MKVLPEENTQPSSRLQQDDSVQTPALVFSDALLRRSVLVHRQAADVANCRLLYSVKSCGVPWVLDRICDFVDGLSASSAFESRLSSQVLRGRGSVHRFSVGFKTEDIAEVRDTVDYVSFNSLDQFRRFRSSFEGVSCGVRVNPELSFVRDKRYDPCRISSKLGVRIDELKSFISELAVAGPSLEGIHVHNNCDSTDLEQLSRTVRRIQPVLRSIDSQLQWVNLGGGYLFDEAPSLDPLSEAVDCLRSQLGVTVFVEPGASIVRDCAFLVASVVDLVKSDGKRIAILDTTVNHIPESFEFDYEPDVTGASESGRYSYLLAGSTCLAGDLFGEYSFEAPLEIGSRVVFENVGAYTTVKWHRFNGINLPTIYELTEGGELILRKSFGYDEFVASWGEESIRC